MSGFTVTSIVTPGDGVHAALAAQADAEVEVIDLGANPCDMCIANAESDDPASPPLHQHCHCQLMIVTVSEIIEAFV